MGVLFLVIGAVLLIAAAASPERVRGRGGVAVVGSIAVAAALALIWFVRTDDPNVSGPQPRWDFYQGGATHPLFWISLGFDAAAVALAGSTLLGISNVAADVAAVATAVGLGAGAIAIFGFTLE